MRTSQHRRVDPAPGAGTKAPAPPRNMGGAVAVLRLARVLGRSPRQPCGPAQGHSAPAHGAGAPGLNPIDSTLALQRTVGNRAVNRILARETKVKIVGGVETNVVRPAVTTLLEDTKIEFWREVKFELLDAKGDVKATGYFDFVLRDPRTHQLVFRELKGDDLKSLTADQKIYVPEFQTKAGGRVRITSAKGNISFTPNRIEQVSPANFQLIGKEHLGKFGAEIGEMATGKKVTNVYIGPEGMKVFYNQADADAFFKTLNITPPKNPAKPPVDDKPLKPPTPNPNQTHPLHDQPGSQKKPDKTPDKPGSYGDPLAGPPPNKNVKRPAHKPLPVDSKPPRVDKPATPPKAPDKPPSTTPNPKTGSPATPPNYSPPTSGRWGSIGRKVSGHGLSLLLDYFLVAPLRARWEKQRLKDKWAKLEPQIRAAAEAAAGETERLTAKFNGKQAIYLNVHMNRIEEISMSADLDAWNARTFFDLKFIKVVPSVHNLNMELRGGGFEQHGINTYFDNYFVYSIVLFDPAVQEENAERVPIDAGPRKQTPIRTSRDRTPIASGGGPGT